MNCISFCSKFRLLSTSMSKHSLSILFYKTVPYLLPVGTCHRYSPIIIVFIRTPFLCIANEYHNFQSSGTFNSLKRLQNSFLSARFSVTYFITVLGTFPGPGALQHFKVLHASLISSIACLCGNL